MQRPLIPTVALVFLVIATSGCDTNEYSAAIEDFGKASIEVVGQMKSAYRLVNETRLQQEILAFATRPEPIAVDPAKAFPPFLPEEDLAIRMTMLDGLQAYATALSGLAGKTSAELDSETARLAGALTSLARNERLQHSLREVKGISQEEVNATSAGLEAMGKVLINKKIAKELPGILAKSDATIEAVVLIFIRELGEPPESPNAGRLRGELGRVYTRMIDSQTQIVNSSRAGSNEKQQNVARLAALVAEQRNADAALAQTQDGFKRLIAAHKALLQIPNTPVTFKTAVAALWADIKAADGYYAKLPIK